MVVSVYLKLFVEDCWYNNWKEAEGYWWAISKANDREAKVLMATSPGSCPGAAVESHTIKKDEVAYFANGSIMVRMDMPRGIGVADVWIEKVPSDTVPPEQPEQPSTDSVISTGMVVMGMALVAMALVMKRKTR